MSRTPDAFRDACSLFATGIAVATVRSGEGEPHGLTVSSFTSVSVEPPLILICIDYGCALLSLFRQNSHFGINILEKAQRQLSVAFSVKPEGRFDGIPWYPAPSGAPFIKSTLARLDCQVKQIVEAGDHAIFIGEVLKIESNPGQPLVYFNRSYRSLR